METSGASSENLDPAGELRALERAEALPYLRYPATPRWYPPAMGLYSAALVALLSPAARDNHALFIALALLCVFGISALLGGPMARYGAFPRVGRGAPREIQGAYRSYFLGLPVVTALVALVWWWAGWVAAGVVAFVLATAAVALYESAYARAAATARRRLGIEALA